MTPINERYVLIAGSGDRTQSSSSTALLVVPDSTAFYKKTDGSFSPSVIHIKATLLLADGPVTFSQQGCTLSSVTDFTCEVAANSVTGTVAIVTATAANNGNPIAQSVILGVVSDGASGQGTNGPRGAGQYYATGNQWSDTIAQMTTPNGQPVLGDVVTISNGTSYALTKRWDGTNWNPMGAVFDGSLFVTGSISSAAIDTRNLTVKDAAGNIILSASSKLKLANFDTATIGSLSALTATFGNFGAGDAGGRTAINDYGMKVYDPNNGERCSFGRN